MDEQMDEIESKVIIVKNIPHGFYEKQMLSFFSQFGKVTRLRLLRSKKYLKSKGIAFVEFAFEDVAKIAAHTMNNYLMFEKLIKCHLVPPSKLPTSVFKSWNRKKISTIKRHKSAASRIRDDTEWNKLKVQKLKKINDTLKKLKDLGIDYQCNMAEETTEAKIVDFLSLTNGNAEESGDESYVTCDSSPKSPKSPKSLRSPKSPKLPKSPIVPMPRERNSLSERKLSLSRSGMKRKLFSLPKFVILNAARRLSL